MEIRLLGPVEVRTAAGLLDVGQPRQRCVLAALAVDLGRPVAVDTLIDRVWGSDPPQRAREALYVYIAGIRKLLAAGEAAGSGENPAPGGAGGTVTDARGGGRDVQVVRRSGGYLLAAATEQVDLYWFRALVEQADEAGNSGAPRAELLRQALRLWSGTPLADLPSNWASRIRDEWEVEYLDALISWAGAESDAGNARVVVGALSTAVERHPLNESLAYTLMQVLHAAGRGADALNQYARTRGHLSDELGVDPGAELQNLYMAILRGEPVDPPGPTPPVPAPPPVAAPPAVAPPAVVVPAVVPAQLPPDIRVFSGREAELERLDGLLAEDGQRPSTVVISVLSGSGGVGKTALAVHWAHRVRDQFPDGQLYVNLRGFDPTGTAVPPADAIRAFLEALDVPAHKIPVELSARVALYRSQLADRRILIVLDNARDAEQVRPLLPASPGCLVVVTSRDQLSSMVAVEGAVPLALRLLSVDESRELLVRRIGADRTTAEPEALAGVIEACDGLPLALAIVAARAATNPDFPLAALAAQLRDARLDSLADADPTTDVRAVLSWSYRALTAPSARLFRLLSLHAGPQVSIPAAASLAGVTIPEIRPLLAELTRTHAVTEFEAGRYVFHDLLRVYAAERAGTVDTPDERDAAVRRVLDYYLRSGYASALLLHPHRDPLTLPPAEPGSSPVLPPDRNSAHAWFAAERRAVFAAIDQATAAGLDTHAYQLAWTLVQFLDWRGLWHDLSATQLAALPAANRIADPTVRAGLHRHSAIAYLRLSQFADSLSELDLALDLFEQAGDDTGQGHTHRMYALVWARQGRYTEALEHAQRAQKLFQAAGHHRGAMLACNSIGWYHAQLGDHDRALEFCQRALEQFRLMGDPFGEAASLDSLGYAYRHLGEHDRSVDSYEQAIRLYRQEMGDRYEEADTLVSLGDTYEAAGQPDAARTVWQRALTILTDLDSSDTERVRARLRGDSDSNG